MGTEMESCPWAQQERGEKVKIRHELFNDNVIKTLE